MHNRFIRMIVSLLLFTSNLSGQVTTTKSLLKLDVNWPQYLAQHDLTLDKISSDYFEGAFAGNGLLGTILFKDDQLAITLRFEIGRTDVYDHRTALPSAYESSRLPVLNRFACR